MSRSLHAAIAPALAGAAFQHSALLAMLPVLSERLALSHAALGAALGAALMTVAAVTPVIARRADQAALGLAAPVLALSSLALALLLTTPPPPVPGALAALTSIRIVQGVATAALLAAAQASAGAASLGAIGRLMSVQALAGGLGAAGVGALLPVSLAAPMAPAILGAAVAALRLRAMQATPPPPGSRLHDPKPPGPRSPAGPAPLHGMAPMLASQTATGLAQGGLGPLLVVGAGLSPLEASGAAGICLAAATLGVLAAHRCATPRAGAAGPAALIGGAALALAPVAPGATTLAMLSALIAGAAATIGAQALHGAMSTRPDAARAVAGWFAAGRVAALGAGVALGAALSALSAGAPFLFGAAAMAVALVWRPS